MVKRGSRGCGGAKTDRGGTQSLPRLTAQQALGCSPRGMWVIAWGLAFRMLEAWDVIHCLRVLAPGACFPAQELQKNVFSENRALPLGAQHPHGHIATHICPIMLCSTLFSYLVLPWAWPSHFSYSILPPNLHQGAQPAHLSLQP